MIPMSQGLSVINIRRNIPLFLEAVLVDLRIITTFALPNRTKKRSLKYSDRDSKTNKSVVIRAMHMAKLPVRPGPPHI